MSNKITRLAVVRENSTNKCPFGLSVVDGCKCAGKLVDNMTSLIPIGNTQQTLSDDEIASLKDANNRVLMFSENENEATEKCKYANFIFDDKQMVECSYGDNSAGVGIINNLNSPSSFQPYVGMGFYSLPLGFYNQNLIDSDGFQNHINQYFASIEKTNIQKKATNDK